MPSCQKVRMVSNTYALGMILSHCGLIIQMKVMMRMSHDNRVNRVGYKQALLWCISQYQLNQLIKVQA